MHWTQCMVSGAGHCYIIIGVLVLWCSSHQKCRWVLIKMFWIGAILWGFCLLSSTGARYREICNVITKIITRMYIFLIKTAQVLYWRFDLAAYQGTNSELFNSPDLFPNARYKFQQTSLSITDSCSHLKWEMVQCLGEHFKWQVPEQQVPELYYQCVAHILIHLILYICGR